jgi:hypothetical protein
MINDDDINDDDIFEELDSSWLNDFEATDKDYNSYYKEDLSFIRINYIYINNENEIVNIFEDKCLFKTPGILSRDELIGLIKRNTIHNEIKYSLLSLLKYNINFEPINLKAFLRSSDKNIGNIYLQSITNIDTIRFDQSISLFHDINNLFIIFIDKSNNFEQNGIIRKRQMTKRIYINSFASKKTKRNLFKETD